MYRLYSPSVYEKSLAEDWYSDISGVRGGMAKSLQVMVLVGVGSGGVLCRVVLSMLSALKSSSSVKVPIHI